MALTEQIDKDVISAMKAREEFRTETLRMAKAALKMKQIDKRAPITDAEAQAVLTIMIKQRRESAEIFAKGNRQELADKELREITLLETYVPKEADADTIQGAIAMAIAEFAAQGAKPGPKDMGTVIRNTQAALQRSGLRADGKQVSELVKAELAK